MSVTPGQIEAGLADLAAPYHRPNPVQWLKYALTARAPRECRTWVLFDVTTRTWVLRRATHVLVLWVPIAAFFWVLLTSFEVATHIKWLLLLNAGGPSFLAGMLFTIPASERRLLYVGYPSELGSAIRQKRAQDKQRADNYARRERIAEKRTRRFG